jgi:hypothetical protein
VVEVVERERYIDKGCNLALERAELRAGKVSMLSGGDDGLGGGLNLHGSTTQKTALNIILAAVRT